MHPTMMLYNLSRDELPKEPCVLALGFFDGVHRGHRQLLEAAICEARSLGVRSGVFTFADNKASPYKSRARLGESDERLRLLAESGVDDIYLADFGEVADTSPKDFVNETLQNKLSVRTAVCGFNFRFGKDAAGDADALRALMRRGGGDAIVLPPVFFGEQPISSSAIRTALEDGDIESANAMLGRIFSINFPVLHGKCLGRHLGAPTINQYFPEGFVLPAYGVYHCECLVDGILYPAVTNVGVRPTVSDAGAVSCETHIIGYRGWLYGKRIRVFFLRRLRPEMKFDSVDALKKQITKDIDEVKRSYE